MGRLRILLQLLAFFLSFYSIAFNLNYSHADTIYGTPGDDVISVPPGTPYGGVISYEGDDTILIDNGAEVASDHQLAAEAAVAADAVAVDAGCGDDRVINNGAGGANAAADALSEGGSAFKAMANASAIQAGDGADMLLNSSAIDATAASYSESGVITMVPDLSDLINGPASEATARGMDSGGDDDEIVNNGTIDAEADTSARSETMLIQIFGLGPIAAPTTAAADAIGIAGGAGNDRLTNDGTMTVSTESDAYTGSGTVGGVQYEAAVFIDVRTEAEATTAGMAAGDGDDSAVNTGTITLGAGASASTLDVSVEIAGDVKANAATTSTARAVGVEGGAGNDSIENTGGINMSSITAVSESKAVDVKMITIPTAIGEFFGADLGDAKTEAVADAAGMAGGAGDDTIAHSGTINLFSLADADSNSVTAALTITASPKASGGSAAVQGSAPVAAAESVALQVSAAAEEGTECNAVVDAGTIARTVVSGIDGGAGMDTVSNTGKVVVKGASDADSVAVNSTVNISKAGVMNIFPSMAFAEAETLAQATATGIDGGSGDDTVLNEGDVTVEAVSDSTSASVAAMFKMVKGADAKKGLAYGGALAKSATAAGAAATGIAGAAGNDFISNAATGKIEVTANPESTSASVGVTVEGSFNKEWNPVLGGSIVDGTTRAVSTVTGIDAGEDGDAVTNAGRISLTANPDADSASIVTNIGAAFGELGVVGGFAFADNETAARATVVGIDGGSGNDTLTNTDTGSIAITSQATGTSASVAMTVEAVKGMGAAVGAALTDGTTTAVSDVAGISGGDGEDTIESSGSIVLDSQSVAKSTSVSVGITGGKEGVAVGASYSDATTTAESTAAGIKNAAGRAAVTNRGAIDSSATAGTDSESMSFTVTAEKTGLAAGVSLADLTTKSIATSSGIHTGDAGAAIGKRSIDNLGTVEADATATTDAQSVAVTLSGTLTGVTAGVSAARTDVTARASSAGLRSGAGADEIVNDGKENTDGFSIESHARATAISESVAVSVSGAWEGVALGASLAAADTRASATAAGIDAAGGDDTVTSKTGIRADAVSNVTSDTVSVNAAFSYKGVSAGVALSDTRTDAAADAVGISGGGGKDDVANQADLQSKAAATTRTKTVTIDIATLGAAIAQASSTASAEAAGLDGGRGVDILMNEGDIKVDADSTADDTNTTVNFAGYASGDVSSSATAAATGIRGDDAGDDSAAGDTIENRTGATIDVDSHARLTADSYTVQGGGAAFADASGTVNALAAGVSSGAGTDTVVNQGSVDVTAWSEASMSSTVMQLTGVSAGKAGANLTTRATGIDAGGGANTVTNASGGKINVISKAKATAASLTLNMGVALQRAAITAETSATGILSGDDKDVIDNHGNIAVSAVTTMGAASGDFSLAGLSFTDSVTRASVEGVNAGGGDDVITNYKDGVITAGEIPDDGDPLAFVEVADVSFSFARLGLGFLGSRASAAGILGGDGDDTIFNAGAIRIGDDDWMTQSKAFGFHGNFLEFFSITGVGAAADTTSIGISGGQGDDGIANESTGVLDVKATTYAISDGAADTTTFGDPKVFANSTTNTTATGISGGQGGDVIVNLSTVSADGTVTDRGMISAFAEARADATTDAWTGWGNPTAKSSSVAVATARGIDAGEGRNAIHNEGEILADSVAGAHSFAKADSNVDSTESTADSHAEAYSYGVSGGSDGNTVYNTSSGRIAATALARTYDPLNGMQTKAETDEYATAKNSDPVTAHSAGIDLGDGDDTVFNEGFVTAKSSADAGTHATSNSWPNYAQSEARATGAATALGIAAGEGRNTIANKGQILVDAWGNASPKAYSYSRDSTSATTAVADARAAATGVEADGEIFNDKDSVIDVKARATADANADTEAETTTAEATLTATAAGIAAVADSHNELKNRIQNDGSIEVAAIAGEDEDSDALRSALADTDIWVRSCRTDGRVESIVSAAGIQATGSAADVINIGDIDVRGRASAKLRSVAYSRDYNPTADGQALASGTAIGISTGAANDLVTNSGTVNVQLFASALPWASADSNLSTTHTNVYAGSTATAKGIAVNEGDNTVLNVKGGSISVESHAVVDSFANSDENAMCYSGTDEESIVESIAVGIEAGHGNNAILSQDDLSAVAIVDTVSTSQASSITFTASAKLWTGGAARATGIAAGDGDNTIVNKEVLLAKADNATAKDRPNTVATYPSAHLDWAYSNAGGEDNPLTADATGISVGDGTNIVENHGIMFVISNLVPEATAWADTTSSTNHAIAEAGGTAAATGILAGDGRNTITNFSDMYVAVSADGYALGYGEDYGEGYIGSTDTAGLVANSTGIKTGDGANTIDNRRDLFVSATAVGSAKGRADTVSASAHGVAIANTSAEATGILTGDGTNEIANSGQLAVMAKAVATVVTEVDSTFGSEYRTRHAAATARSYGIRTGSGVNQVENKGTITVTAETQATNVDGEAVGIRTGEGSDTVINSGTIAAEFIANGVSTIGTGIDTDAGDDAVHLLDQSVVEGRIVHGEGNDTLLLAGSALVAGHVSGGAGDDWLLFDGEGRVDGLISDFETAIKQGRGTATVNSLGPVNRIEALEGTLEIGDGYNLAADGSFGARLNGDGTHGQLKLAGDVELAGELEVIRGRGVFRNGTVYDILLADNVRDSFDSENLLDGMPLLRFRATTYADRVEVEATTKKCTTVAANGLQKKIAQHLDRIMPTASGDMALALGEFQALSKQDFDSAFSSLSPDSYNNSSTASLSFTQHYTKTIQQRMHSLRAGLDFAAADTRPGHGVWLQGFGQLGDQDSEDGYTGYDFDLYGGTVGADRFFSDRLLLGFSLGAARADIDLDNNMGDGEIDAYIGSLYGSWFTKRYYLDASLSYGYQEYDNSRNINIGGLQRTADSDHDGSIFSGYLEGGYNFSFGNLMLGPFGALNYLYLDEEDFSESGAGSLNLSVDDRQTQALFSQLGAVVAGRLTYESFELMPELRLAWKHDFDIDDQTITSAFAGAPGAKFSIDGQDVERNSFIVEIGTTIFHKSGLMFPIKYAAEVSDDYTAQGILGVVRYEF